MFPLTTDVQSYMVFWGIILPMLGVFIWAILKGPKP